MHVVGADIHSVLENDCLAGYFPEISFFFGLFLHLNIDFVINQRLRSSCIFPHAFPQMQGWSGVKLVLDICRFLFFSPN